MPLHDWARVPAALFHDFHQSWTVRIARALNGGMLPTGLGALIAEPPASADPGIPVDNRGTARGKLSDAESYCRRANVILIKRHLASIVAVVDVVSPGNKESKRAIREFADRNCDYLQKGIHVLIVDVFRPTPHDPSGIHQAIWNEFQIDEGDFVFPRGKDRIVVSYEAGWGTRAYVEPLGLAEPLPDMPLFLASDRYIVVPLETTYQETWDASPEGLRVAVETGRLPEVE